MGKGQWDRSPCVSIIVAHYFLLQTSPLFLSPNLAPAFTPCGFVSDFRGLPWFSWKDSLKRECCLVWRLNSRERVYLLWTVLTIQDLNLCFPIPTHRTGERKFFFSTEAPIFRSLFQQTKLIKFPTMFFYPFFYTSHLKKQSDVQNTNRIYLDTHRVTRGKAKNWFADALPLLVSWAYQYSDFLISQHLGKILHALEFWAWGLREVNLTKFDGIQTGVIHRERAMCCWSNKHWKTYILGCKN